MPYHDETRRIHALARDPATRWKWTGHAEARMRERDISRLDVRTVLQRGAVVRVEQPRFEVTWNVRGRDGDGRPLEIVVVARDDALFVTVITAWEA
ncbi:DUF4258 domain-containing protein [uncultured Rhodospira sp.]|uniref:DUF4258 domain-containing protein n=1 Tax=uncultured Rhodospira sp. TaxID=1936189 RepID=UPI00262FA356|nr:DUF4258 domain-containing protein [uncultured Rhodospira sp.]